MHLNDIAGIPFTMFVDVPAVLTIHHPHDPLLSQLYEQYPDVHYVTIATLARRAASRCRTFMWFITGSPWTDYTFSGAEGRLRGVSRTDGAVQGAASGDRGGAAGRHSD